MINGKKILGGTALVFLIMIAVLWVPTFGFHRPYVNWAPWDLAEYLVKNDRPARECFDLIWFEIMAPSQTEQRAQCVYEYAKFKKDPAACELIMPSSYGIYCIGSAEEHLPCDVTSIPYSVYWRDGNIENTAHLRECVRPNSKRSEFGNACCEVAKVAFLTNENDCSRLKGNTPVYDHCLYNLAWKLHDPGYCSDMTSENPRAACEVQAKALQTDPRICDDCQQPVDSVNDLK